MTLSSFNAYICQSCSIPNNCKTCIIFSSLSQSRLSLAELKKIGSYNELQKLDYAALCTSCPENYIRKEDNKCYLCSLVNCYSCSYGNSTYYDIAKIGTNPTYNLLNNLKNTNFQQICSNCGNLIATIVSNMTECKSCATLIPNCNSCTYGGYNIASNAFVVFDSSTYWRDSLKIDKYRNITAVCKSCTSGYAIANQTTGFICFQCPSNCEFCYYLLSQNQIVCGRCKVNYVLNYDTGGCLAFALVSSIPNTYKSECSRIIRTNPLKTYITGASSYLCQTCINSQKFPSISGNCAYNGDYLCALPFELYQKGTSSYNVTYYLSFYPQLLKFFISMITNNDFNFVSACTTCKEKYAFYSEEHQCCSADLSINQCMSCLSCKPPDFLGSWLDCGICKIYLIRL